MGNETKQADEGGVTGGVKTRGPQNPRLRGFGSRRSEAQRIKNHRQRRSDGHGAGNLLVLDDEVGVTLVIVKDNEDLGVQPVVHAGVVQVARGVPGVEGGRASHGGIAHGDAACQHLGQEHEVHALGRALGEVVRVHGLTGKVAALAKHGGVFAAHTRVKVVLADAVHHVLRRAVEEVALV